VSDTTVTPATPLSAGERVLLVALVPLAALVWWLVGALPELLDRLAGALAELSQDPSGAAELPRPPLLAAPMGGIGLQVPNALLGGIVAGFLAGLATGQRRIMAARATLAGVALGLAVVMVQAAVAGPDPGGTILLGDSSGAAIALAMILAALGGGLLGSRASTSPLRAGIALGAVSGLLPLWLLGLVFVVAAPGPDSDVDLAWTQWAGLAVLVLALVRVGLRPLRRSAWWPLVVVLPWILVTGAMALPYLIAVPLTAGEGTTSTSELLSFVWQTFGAGAWAPLKRPLPWLGAVVVAVGIALIRARARTAPSAPVSLRPDGAAAPR
jgi:hypothetical protein